VQSPAKQGLRVGNQALAEAIAAEWRGQGDDIDLELMPLTRMSFGAMDISADEIANLQAHIAGYAETDLLCYRVAEAEDNILSAKQHAAWNPWLAWAKQHCRLHFEVTEGIMPIAQAPEVLLAVRGRVNALSAWELVPMGILTGQLGSYVLAEAVRTAALDVVQAITASFLDDEHQREKWGADVEAEARQQKAATEINQAAAFMHLL
jgi:chaperone required for assembly of F1-ATPase